jgi:RNA polymerase sigma factor (sigma-70 family)
MVPARRRRMVSSSGDNMTKNGQDPSDDSSFELLRRSRSGDVEALNRLLARYLPALRRWAHGRLPMWSRDLSDTQDLVQDTLIQAVKHLGTFQPQHEGALQAYLRMALMNRIRDELRRSHRRPSRTELPEAMAAKSASPLEEAIGYEALEAYETALSELRETDREAIIARVELGQSYEEVAAILGKPSADAARVAVHRAMLRLAEKMNRES